MKSFHKTMGYLAGIFILIIITSITVASSYISRNNISLTHLFFESSSLKFDREFDFQFDSILNNLEKSSQFDTQFISKTQTFALVNELFISSSIENITFIEEDRDDIKVDYYRELPNSKFYTVDYDATSTKEKLTITAAVSVKNLTINKDYIGTITIYVPSGYKFNKITLDSGISKLTTENIYTHTDHLTVISSLGDVDLYLSQQLKSLSITSQLGSIKLGIEAPIGELYINCDLGHVNLNIQAPINDVSIKENLGDVLVNSTSSLGFIKIHNNMGKIEAIFLDEVKGTDFSTNMGSIDVAFNKNKDITVYIENNLGSVINDYVVTEKDKTSFIFISNMGKISIH
jgi:hypothetical protein